MGQKRWGLLSVKLLTNDFHRPSSPDDSRVGPHNQTPETSGLLVALGGWIWKVVDQAFPRFFCFACAARVRTKLEPSSKKFNDSVE